MAIKEALSSSWRSMFAGLFLGFVVGFSFSYMGAVTTVATVNSVKVSECNALTLEKLTALQRGLQEMDAMKTDLKSVRETEEDIRMLAQRSFEIMKRYYLFTKRQDLRPVQIQRTCSR